MTNGETKKSGTEGAAGPGAEAGTEGAAAPEAAQPRTPSRRALLGWGGAGLAL
ncbi:deferrochelatase/peroxidase EfeB, partial [Streptomyces sp. SID5471]|nr:deferrochelatase/peroxidase EfeB [Streptomyces sp. SID5471]